MVLCIETGSTVKFFIDELACLKGEEGLALDVVVTTSSRSKAQLENLGFVVTELTNIDQLDLTVDGADRADSRLDGIKGGGAALTLEKNVSVNSKKNVWIIDENKVVDYLRGCPLPVEVSQISCKQVKQRFNVEGLNAEFRLNKDDNRLKTHYGNQILDLMLDTIPVPSGLVNYLDRTVDVGEHGLFVNTCDNF